ncbi:MAG: hypothetical protein NC299_08060 [Lachnospiraceae bacterium]|nr:hypothetical protein [Ruminococcus sp.]MCM1275306.1 hypothetical protein [Lachnospiraceae bacterium]
MVWNSTQSALYKAIDKYNGDAPAESKAENNARECPRAEREAPCARCPKSRAPADPVSRILSDRDMLLIAGLIFVLLRENADKKLILALAIVLLG